MAANPPGPIELAMTQYADGRACQRPSEVRSMVDRLLRWSGQVETCGSCSAAPALSIVAGAPLCVRCREQRSVRMVSTDDLTGLSRRGVAETVPGARLFGHAIVFDRWSVDLGGFVERIRPQASNRMMNTGADVRALWNHNSDFPIGRSGAQPVNLRYWNDAKGVAVAIKPPSSATAFVEAIELGNVTGMSFGFRMIEDEWFMDGAKVKRDVLDMLVSEFSAVVFPAYLETDISVGVPQNRVAFLKKWHRTRLAQ